MESELPMEIWLEIAAYLKNEWIASNALRISSKRMLVIKMIEHPLAFLRNWVPDQDSLYATIAEMQKKDRVYRLLKD